MGKKGVEFLQRERRACNYGKISEEMGYVQ